MQPLQASVLQHPKAIERFDGQHRFLSNFFPTPLLWKGYRWPTAEHAYQAAKCKSLDQFRLFLNAPSPGAAKRMGRRVVLRMDWDEVKEEVMLSIVRAKFENKNLRRLLDATGNAELIEGKLLGRSVLGSLPGSGRKPPWKNPDARADRNTVLALLDLFARLPTLSSHFNLPRWGSPLSARYG